MMAAADHGGPGTDMDPDLGTSGHVTLEKPFQYSIVYR